MMLKGQCFSEQNYILTNANKYLKDTKQETKYNFLKKNYALKILLFVFSI
jgi:hypothetical protein